PVATRRSSDLEMAGDGQTDAPRSAGDDRGLALNGHVHLFLPFGWGRLLPGRRAPVAVSILNRESPPSSETSAKHSLSTCSWGRWRIATTRNRPAPVRRPAAARVKRAPSLGAAARPWWRGGCMITPFTGSGRRKSSASAH